MRKKWLWLVMLAVLSLLVALCVWLVLSDSPIYRAGRRFFEDRQVMEQALSRLGIFAPLAFIGIQALQVVVAPIPGEITGFLGGVLFGQWLGFLYSTIGLTAGSLGAFWIGRALGASVVQRWVDPRVWQRMGFIVEAEGAVLCFVIFVIPGLPKDIGCYLFGLSPMPFWVFAAMSTLGRIPGTWVLSAQGAQTAAGHYTEFALLTAAVAAVAIPLYYYRHRIEQWGRSASAGRSGETKANDGK